MQQPINNSIIMPNKFSDLTRIVNSAFPNFLNTIKKLKQANKNIKLENFCDLIRKYNLKDALIAIARTSQHTFHRNDDFNYTLLARDGSVLTNMYSLALLAHFFIISNANDRNRPKISEKALANVVYLSRVVTSNIKQPLISTENILAQLIKEQVSIQLPFLNKIARNFVMFSKILNSNDFIKEYGSSAPKDLNTIFEENTGLTLKDYFENAFIIFCWTKHQDILLDEKYFASIANFEQLFSIEKLMLVINFLKTTYKEYNNLHTKNPLINVLQIKPIIEFDDKRGYKYVIPNISFYLEKVYNNIFYDFEAFYESKSEKEKLSFRAYFGFIFQEYIGFLLKDRFKDCGIILPEITYKKANSPAKFVDWILDYKDKYYLIEVKSKTVPLEYIYNKKLEDYYKAKIIPEIIKFYNKVTKDINHSKLAFLKKKKNVLILLFKDMPLINSSIIKDLIIKNIKDDDDLINSINNNEILLMDCEEFEYIVEAIYKNLDIELLYQSITDDPSKNLIQIINEQCPEITVNESLMNIYNDVFGFIEQYNPHTKNETFI